mgnify:CR=1 FL=1
MNIFRRPPLVVALGASAIFLLARFVAGASAPEFAARLSTEAPASITEAGGGGHVRAIFLTQRGLPSRHPLLVGGEPLDETTRADIAHAVASIPGVGGIRWSDGDMMAMGGEQVFRPLHCQEDVQALLRARSIRFEESSSRMDIGSDELIDEVVTALRPCLGAIILITGHTDNSGPEPGNIALSSERANAVRAALVEHGIPADGLRTRGVGSRRPVEGLEPTDPANRRIEFSVIATEPIRPTPVDTPAPR